MEQARPDGAGTSPWLGAPDVAVPGADGTVDVEGLRLPADLVTGEAVVLDLRPASLGGRGLALLLDLVIQVAVLVAALAALGGPLSAVDEAAATAVSLVVVVAVLVGLPVTVETLTRGRSVGKIAAGLRVVRDDGGPIRFRQAFVRGLLAVPEVYALPFVALLTALSTRQGKRAGDLLAGTYVVRERSGTLLPRPVPMPPHLAAWAGTADLGRIPERLALAARGYLDRSRSLHPQARQRLGVALADQVARHVGPPPPAGTLPEDFLAAVLAERTRRALERLGRQEESRAARDRRRADASVLSPSSHRLLGP